MSVTPILVLGHRGMLGRTASRYFNEQPGYEAVTIDTRWGDSRFLTTIQEIKPQFIINCIGKIPQKHASDEDYQSINLALPRALETIGIPVIHPSTDCEFKGDLSAGMAYAKHSVRDAVDSYGQSKAQISAEIERSFQNTKIIRTSIIGHEEKTAVALLDWFLAQEGTVNGYVNHYWNGVTTLQWSKLAHQLIKNWLTAPIINQYGTATHYSKHDLITTAKAIYQKDIEIVPFTTEKTINKCLESDLMLPDISEQLLELRAFFQK